MDPNNQPPISIGQGHLLAMLVMLIAAIVGAQGVPPIELPTWLGGATGWPRAPGMLAAAP